MKEAFREAGIMREGGGWSGVCYYSPSMPRYEIMENVFSFTLQVHASSRINTEKALYGQFHMTENKLFSITKQAKSISPSFYI